MSVRTAVPQLTALLLIACSRQPIIPAPTVVQSLQPPNGVRDLVWLAGCWERRRGNVLTEEQWLPPRGDMLLGMSRTTRGDSVVEYEFLRIFARADSVILVAQPSGQTAAEFAATAGTQRAITFENPAHDFPQRIHYEAVRSDSLRASIDGVDRGQQRTVRFDYGRVPCPLPR